MSASQIQASFSGISNTSSFPPHNGLAVGPNNIVMAEGSRIEWTNLTGAAATLQSIYQFFSPLGPTATNSLFDTRCVYDSVNQRYIVTADNIGANGTISNIDVAVSKDANPNDGWYFASLNTSLTINGQLTSSDQPTVSVDGTNIYITAPQYNVNVSGYAGTECWIIGDTAGAGGGIYNGGTLTVTANEVTPATQGIFRSVTGNNGKTYYACDYNNGSQIVVSVQVYDVATNTFGPVSTVALGNIDQGGAYTSQQLGTNLLLDAGDKRIQNLQYANGFLYGLSELKPIGSTVPLVHWFKIDVNNPNSPTLVAQGDISGAALGTNVATFDGSIAVDNAGDVIINFTASGPNMYPSDYYVFKGATDTSFSAPILYQASTGFFNSGNGASVQRWGLNSSAIVDPNNPNAFWISGEYVANGWWQTSVAQVMVVAGPPAPTGLSLDTTTDSGTKGDGITNVVQVTIDGTAPAGSAVTLYDTNGTTVIGTGLADATGAFGITTSALADATHSITARATTAAGTSSASTPLAVTVDTVAPPAPSSLSLNTATDSAAKGDAITNFAQVRIDGTAAPGSTVTLFDTNGTTVLGIATAAVTGAFGVTTSVLSDGIHGITARATDAAGNTSTASSVYPVTVDTIAPTAPTSLSLDAATDSGVLGDGTTNFVQVKIDGTAEAGNSVALYDTNGTTAIGTGTADAITGAFAITTSVLSAGTHSVTAKATDAAGNTSVASPAYAVTVNTPPPPAPTGSTSETEALFAGISNPGSYPPDNGLAVGPNNIVMSEGSRVEWTNLAGGTPTLQSIYQFFNSLGPTATNALFDARCVYDSFNQRYIITVDNIGSGGNISNIDIAVSKDSNPNHGWYFATLNTSLTINNQLTSSDQPHVSVDGTNIYITAPQYNVGSSGLQGTECWVIGDTVGPGGGIYNGGTLTVTANQIASATQGIVRVAAGNNGKSYYASAHLVGSQTIVTVQTYDVTTSTFNSASSVSLGNIDQTSGGSNFTAQQQGTNLLLDAGDRNIRSLTYANGFLYGESEIKPIGSSVPAVHWFKIDVSNPNVPTLVAQGDVSGAAIGANVATFNGSIAVDTAGDVIINFTASSPNMFPSDYYVFQSATDTSFSAPVLYQASTQFFDSGNGSATQRWGNNSSAVVDPNNPHSFWLSNEYVANGWWQTSVAQISIQTVPEAPTLAIGNPSLTVTAGGSVALPISISPFDSDDTVSMTVTGLTNYETVTDNLDQLTFSGSSVTLSAAQVNSGLILHSSYTGIDHPVNTLTVIASNTTPGELATSAPQTIVVTDPPATSLTGGTNALSPGTVGHLVALMDQFAAAGFHHGQTDDGAITSISNPHKGEEDLAFLTIPRHH